MKRLTMSHKWEEKWDYDNSKAYKSDDSKKPVGTITRVLACPKETKNGEYGTKYRCVICTENDIIRKIFIGGNIRKPKRWIEETVKKIMEGDDIDG